MICITFDTDHMGEGRMAEFLDRVEIPGLATFFCTQRYRVLEQTRHEIAPHPYLAEGGDWARELEDKRREFPDAIGWRSHSCVFSHLLAEWLGKNGYRYVSCHDELGREDIRPIRHAWGIWQFPIYYMDNLDFSRRRFWSDEGVKPFSPTLIETACRGSGLYVFDFHPIHLLLNTPDADFYFQARNAFLTGAPIEELEFRGYGAASFFRDLCSSMARAGLTSLRLDALDKSTTVLAKPAAS